MVTRTFGDGHFATIGTYEENTEIFYDVSANRLVIQTPAGGTVQFGRDDQSLVFGTGGDAEMLWSTGDASNHALVVATGDSNQSLHITDLGAKATDWNIAATTHPNLYIHSNTTPATDYLRLGDHDGTTGYIDVVGGTTLALEIGGTTEVAITATDVDLQSNTLSNVGAAGNDFAAGAWTMSPDAATSPSLNIRGNGNADAKVTISGDHDNSHGTAHDASVDLLHNGSVVFQVGYDGSLDGLVLSRGTSMGTDDAIRLTNASPSVVTFDTTKGSDHDYACQGCGKTALEPFECCGLVEWHDDVLALQSVNQGLQLLEQLEAGDDWRPTPALQHMHDIGILEISQNMDGTPWIGMNMVPAQWYTWSALRQVYAKVNELEGQVKALTGAE